MAKYKLVGDGETRQVWLNDKPLFPGKSQAFRNHSPDGFNWGYYGSGCAQLALAIMLETGDNYAKYYQKFKEDVIAKLPQGQNFIIEFEITFEQIEGSDFTFTNKEE